MGVDRIHTVCINWELGRGNGRVHWRRLGEGDGDMEGKGGKRAGGEGEGHFDRVAQLERKRHTEQTRKPG